jgi:hypothetical protein
MGSAERLNCVTIEMCYEYEKETRMVRQPFNRLGLILLTISLFLVVPMTLAAQETAAETPTGPSGLMVLAFVLGVAGILFVGVRWLVLDSFQADDE